MRTQRFAVAFIFAGMALPILSCGNDALAQQRTSATYEEWTVRCEMRERTKSCELVQTVQVQGQANPLAQIAIGRLSKSDPLRVVVQVPINVWLPSGAKLVTDDKDPGVLGSFKRCFSGACFADADVGDDLIKKWRALTENGKLLLKNAAQEDVVIPVSWKGFGQAYDAMLKQ